MKKYGFLCTKNTGVSYSYTCIFALRDFAKKILSKLESSKLSIFIGILTVLTDGSWCRCG